MLCNFLRCNYIRYIYFYQFIRPFLFNKYSIHQFPKHLSSGCWQNAKPERQRRAQRDRRDGIRASGRMPPVLCTGPDARPAPGARPPVRHGARREQRDGCEPERHADAQPQPRRSFGAQPGRSVDAKPELGCSAVRGRLCDGWAPAAW